MTAATGAAPVIRDRSIESFGRQVWRRFRRHRLAMASLVLLLVFIALAAAAPVVAPHGYSRVNPLKPSAPPDAEYILGTDAVGRDVWARVVYGGRVSLAVGFVAVTIAMLIAIVLGTVSGYYGRSVDMIIMRVTDVFMNFPSLMLMMIVLAAVGPNVFNTMIVLGITGWTGTTRLLRGQILSVRAQDFVTAARCLGVPDRKIMRRHILPNAMAPLLVAATFGIAGAILAEAGLSFIGLGVLPPTPSWGQMLNTAQNLSILENYWWLWVPPGVAIVLTVLAINFVGDGLRDALDPRISLN